MILFTSGFPKSGKTTFAKQLVNHLDGKLVIHINPADYYMDDFDELTQEDQTSVATTAWEMSLEKATKSICALPNKALIIFDTCCSKSLHMRPLFMNSKLRGHDVLLVYIDADQESRALRTTKRIQELESRYKESFLETLPTLKALADHFIMVSNTTEEKLSERAKSVSDKIKGIRSS